MSDIKYNKEDKIELCTRLKLAVKTKENVQGLTHNFYKYPARFSPKFVKEIIHQFSKPGDVILDPFMGGGTTLVEALACNRHSIGFDINPIATFVAKTKTTLLATEDLEEVGEWIDYVLQKRIKGTKLNSNQYKKEGYLNNLPWTIRRSIEIILENVELLRTEKQRIFATCILLKTAQWAIDCRKTVPSATEFRNKYLFHFNKFSNGINELSITINKHSQNNNQPICISLNHSAENIDNCKELDSLPSKPKLIITSPPYIGVHMLYHQWQLNSRKRTRAPYWIINSLDGLSSSHYTFGHYQSHVKNKYFDIAEKAFSSIHSIVDQDAIVVQLVGFSFYKKYLNKYLEMMSRAGYEEIPISTDAKGRIKRIWRNVPNRKWYVNSNNKTSTSKEVLLIHKPRKKL
jgi:hypothetical protein